MFDKYSVLNYSF